MLISILAEGKIAFLSEKNFFLKKNFTGWRYG